MQRMDEYESTNEVTKTNILWLRMAWLAEFGGHRSYKRLILRAKEDFALPLFQQISRIYNIVTGPFRNKSFPIEHLKH